MTNEKTYGGKLTQLEFSECDHGRAEAIAIALGYEQFAYTSTSALCGLLCLPENPATARRCQRTTGGCVIKTRELGFLFVQDGEDCGMGCDWSEISNAKRGAQ